MCSRFVINGQYLDTFGQLVKHIGSKEGIAFVGSIPSDKDCLCSVDIQTLVNQLNQRAVSDGMDIFFGDDTNRVAEEDLCGYPWEVQS